MARSALMPAALLGLVGLPLIVQFGPHSEIPEWTYALGLPTALFLGGMTAMRTTAVVRTIALVATLLLTCLCVLQLTNGWPAYETMDHSREKPRSHVPAVGKEPDYGRNETVTDTHGENQ